MILVDTSVWVEILRDKKGYLVKAFRERIGTEICVFSRFTQLEPACERIPRSLLRGKRAK